MSFNLKSSNFNHPRETNKKPPGSDNSENTPNYNTQANNSSQNQINEDSDSFHSWKAPEFETYEKSARWYLIGATFLAAVVIYALFSDSPIMAITFILLGIVGFIHLQKDPRIVTFAITSKGIQADNQIYSYENIYSFWIFYEEPNIKIISLHTRASILPYVHIPLHHKDPVKLRELLLLHIPEIQQEHGLIDTLERVLHI